MVPTLRSRGEGVLGVASRRLVETVALAALLAVYVGWLRRRGGGGGFGFRPVYAALGASAATGLALARTRGLHRRYLPEGWFESDGDGEGEGEDEDDDGSHWAVTLVTTVGTSIGTFAGLVPLTDPRFASLLIAAVGTVLVLRAGALVSPMTPGMEPHHARRGVDASEFDPSVDRK